LHDVADKEHTWLCRELRRWKESELVYTPKQDFASTGRLGMKSQSAFERTADRQVEIGQPEGITAQLPPLVVMCQSRVYLRTPIGYHTRDMIALRCTNSSPGTDAPEMCMKNRNRTRRGEPGDSLIDNTAPLGSCPTQKYIPWCLDISGKEYFAAAFNQLITVWQ